MRLWPRRTPARQCPFTCPHRVAKISNVGTFERPRMMTVCVACGTTWLTVDAYTSGATGILPTTALPSPDTAY